MACGTRRDLKKEELWRRRLGTQAGSGLSVRAWCRQHELRESAFHWWRRQLAQRAVEAPTFAPVRVLADTPAAAAGRIEILLPGDRRVRVIGRIERQTLAAVLAVLADSARAAEAPGC